MTDHTEALDIEAIERTIRQGVQVLRLGVTENARMDPADIAEHKALEALDRLIQALKASNEENICDACGGTGVPTSGPPCMCNGSGKMSDAARYLREELVASNEERERVRALVPHIRARQRSGWVANDFDWLCAALSTPNDGQIYAKDQLLRSPKPEQGIADSEVEMHPLGYEDYDDD